MTGNASISDLAHITLAPVRDEYLPELYSWSTNPATSFRWRFGGATPSPEQFSGSLWNSVLCQYVAIDPARHLHGLVVCYDADHSNGHAWVAVQGSSQTATGSGAMVGFLQLIDHAFTHWSFRKLYCDIPGYNAEQFVGVLRRHLVIEGTLKHHTFYNGEFWDRLTCAIYRDAWIDEIRPRFSKLLAGEGPKRLVMTA